MEQKAKRRFGPLSKDVSHGQLNFPASPDSKLMTEEHREAAHQDHILRSFNAYRYQHLSGNNLRRQALAALPAAQQALLPDQSALLTVGLFRCTISSLYDALTLLASTRHLGP